MSLGTFLGGVSASDGSDASLVAVRCSPADVAGELVGAEMVWIGSARGAIWMKSGFGKSEPSVPVRCGGVVARLGELPVHAVQLVDAWSPLHHFFVLLRRPLSQVPPAAIFDLQPPMSKP